MLQQKLVFGVIDRLVSQIKLGRDGHISNPTLCINREIVIEQVKVLSTPMIAEPVVPTQEGLAGGVND